LEDVLSLAKGGPTPAAVFFVIVEPLRLILCIWTILFVENLQGMLVITIFSGSLAFSLSVTFFVIYEVFYPANLRSLIMEASTQTVLLVLNIVILEMGYRLRQIYIRLAELTDFGLDLEEASEKFSTINR
jgi:hypothetical protein